MSRYFHISQGLRGMYMPDTSYVIRCETRRDLKAALEGEARDLRDAEFVGLSKRAIAWLAATLWRRAGARDYFGESVAPYRAKYQTHYPYGLMGAPATRVEWLEYEGSFDRD